MATDAALLADVGFFKLLDDDERAVLAQQVEHRTIPAGTTIFHEGDPGGIMYIIRSGRVELWLYDEDRQRVVLATFEEGDFFGEMALFTGEPRTANVVAMEETEVLEIGHAAMKRVFDTNPDLVESLSFIIAERRQGLASHPDSTAPVADSSAGLLSAIKRFFGL